MNHKDTKAQRTDLPEGVNRTAKQVVDAAFKVHSTLGPGLLENVYLACMAHELRKRGAHVQTELQLPVVYDEIKMDVGFRLDLLVNENLIVELKAVDEIHPVFKAQILTYLKLTGVRLGLLINFNVPLIKDGIQRIIL